VPGMGRKYLRLPLCRGRAVDICACRSVTCVIEGIIQERSTPKGPVRAAKQEGKRASLVEQERPTSSRVGRQHRPRPRRSPSNRISADRPVRRGCKKRFRLRFPMVVGPRYISRGSAPGPSSAWLVIRHPRGGRTPRVSHPGRPPGAARAESSQPRGRAGSRHSSGEPPPRTTRSKRRAGGRTLPDRARREPRAADRDFELCGTHRRSDADRDAFTERKGAETVSSLLCDADRPRPRSEGLRLPREVIFVIDNSGSMHGISIDQGRPR